jgi:transposase
MAGIEITRLDMTAGELRQASGGAQSARGARRILALALVLEGVDRTTAARSCGMDRQTLRDWVHRYNAEGLAGLENRKPSGRPAKLKEEQEQALIALVEAGPEAGVDKVVRWRRIDLRDKLEERFGVTVHERTIGKHLAKLGYRRLSVRPHNPKADLQAQAAFKKTSPTR